MFQISSSAGCICRDPHKSAVLRAPVTPPEKDPARRLRLTFDQKMAG